MLKQHVKYGSCAPCPRLTCIACFEPGWGFWSVLSHSQALDERKLTNFYEFGKALWAGSASAMKRGGGGGASEARAVRLGWTDGGIGVVTSLWHRGQRCENRNGVGMPASQPQDVVQHISSTVT